jgi:hypothetical protein
MADLRDFRVHTCALNARDLDHLAAHAVAGAPCFCDGEWVGEGPEALRRALEQEFRLNEDAIVRLGTVDGEPAALEFDAGGVERAVLRFRNDPRGRIRELRIDHRPAALVALAGAPEPAA